MAGNHFNINIYCMGESMVECAVAGAVFVGVDGKRNVCFEWLVLISVLYGPG